MTSLHRPLLIVIAGPNGSGKTTITSKLLKHEWLEDAIYVNPDNVARDKFGDWNSSDAILKAAQYCEKLREECLSNHKSLIFETVLSAPDKVDFIKRAIAEGYFVRLFFVATCDPTINAARIASRVMEGGHDVPIPKIISRYAKSILNCQLLVSIVDRLYVYDNSHDGEEARLLFRKAKGELIKQYVENIPLWAKNIIMTPTREELIKRLKEISEDKTEYELSLGAMCYSMLPPKTEYFECDNCGEKIEYGFFMSSYKEIYDLVSEIKELGFDVKVEDLCSECLKNKILSGEYSYSEKITKRLDLLKHLNIVFYFRASNDEKFHIAVSNNSYDYIALLNFLKGKNQYYGSFGKTHLLREELDLIEEMSGLKIE